MLSEIEEILETHFEDSDGALPCLEVQEDSYKGGRIWFLDHFIHIGGQTRMARLLKMING